MPPYVVIPGAHQTPSQPDGEEGSKAAQLRTWGDYRNGEIGSQLVRDTVIPTPAQRTRILLGCRPWEEKKPCTLLLGFKRATDEGC